MQTALTARLGRVTFLNSGALLCGLWRSRALEEPRPSGLFYPVRERSFLSGQSGDCCLDLQQQVWRRLTPNESSV